LKDFIALTRGKIFTVKCKILKKNIILGPGLKIFKKLIVGGGGHIKIGKNCVIKGIPGDTAQYVTIDTHSTDATITIGENAVICAARISATYNISIGDDFIIEESGITDTNYHTIERSREKPENENKENSKVIIGDRVAVGARSFITKGIHIGDDVIVAPGSIVANSIPPGKIVLGNPAKEVKMKHS